MEDNQLDKLVNRLIDDQGFSAQDADWNRFATFKDAEQKTKKPFLYKWILNSVILLIAISGIYAYVQSSKNNITTKAHTSNTPKNTTVENNPINNEQDNEMIPESNNNEINKKVSSITQKNSSNYQTSTTQNSSINSQTNSTIDFTKKTNIQPNDNVVKSYRKNKIEDMQSPLIINTKRDNENKGINNSYNINSNNKSSTNKLVQKNILSVKIESKNNSTTFESFKSKNIEIQKISYQKFATISNEIFNSNNKISEASIKKVYIGNDACISSSKKLLTNPINAIAEVVAKSVEPQSISIQNNNNSIKRPMYNDEQLANWQLYIQAGTSIQKGLTGNYSEHKNWSPTPYISTEFDKQINTNTSINIGLGYSYNNALNTQYKRLLSKYYFGRDTSSFTAQFSHYHYLAIPLSIKYQLSKNTFTTAGLGATYMLDVKSNLYDKINGSRAEYGYGTGFNRTDAYFIGGVGVKISSHFLAEAQYHLGFTDVTKNAYFNNTINDKQARINIGISYLIHKK